ncbi:FAS1-like dehydratase domain-containing protein [Microlunatus flavus]|uniref:N-terminal half of MaoC dehydratase n=1 Tax=Microlunatus flavus TaxID=1036181 RepID=A0A1H9LT99_9ACTN|nr:MaoC family dehydratase N-terminal domain-containing protein [Microlunatus flavus]SER14691.1 N-terminal half of MaoC dehydratase [Microlunatus flavus]
MPITPDHAGKAYAPTEPYEVTRVKLAEFAAAVGEPALVEEAHPAAPPTFAAVVTNAAWGSLFTDPELGLSLERVVHADQQFRYTRELRAGDLVTATLRIDKVRVRGATEIVSVTVDVADVLGAPVLSAASTFVHTREEAA